MNIKNWNGKKKTLALFLAIFLIIGLIATIFIVQTRQETRISAQKATVLSLTPSTQTVQVGQEVNLDLIIDPGVNQVNFVKAVIKFDATKFDSFATTFTLDSNSSLNLVAEPVISDGQIIITLDIGTASTNVITTPGKIGTLKLVTWDQNTSEFNSVIAGETQITFDDTQTEVRSIAGTDTFDENVLSSTNPATITIEAVCRVDVANCSWDATEGATSYHYVITDIDSDQVILEGDTDANNIEFEFIEDVNYSCSVAAVNECGSADPGEGTGACEAPLVNVTPTPSLSPGPTVTLTPAPTRQSGPTPSVTLTPTPTPTPSPSSTSTPTPTVTSYNSPNPTSVESTSESPTPTYIAEATLTPSLAPTGNPVVMIGGIIGGILIILGGIALLML